LWRGSSNTSGGTKIATNGTHGRKIVAQVFNAPKGNAGVGLRLSETWTMRIDHWKAARRGQTVWELWRRSSMLGGRKRGWTANCTASSTPRAAGSNRRKALHRCPSFSPPDTEGRRIKPEESPAQVPLFLPTGHIHLWGGRPPGGGGGP